jgi:hypothetical protein
MKITAHLLFVALFVTGFATNAQAADAPIVREIYTCNFNDGKDLDDLMAARDFYLKQMDKAGQQPSEAFVWTPYKAAVEFDFLWANNSADLVAFGRTADAFNNSVEGQASMDRFNQVATCTSSLAMRRQFFQAPGEFSGDPASPQIIGAAACDLQRGTTQEDIDDLLRHLGDVLGTLNRQDGFVAFASQPTTGAGPNTRDLYLYGVQGTVEDWAARSIAIQASAGGPSLSRHFNNVVDCDQALFFGQRVVPKAE